MIVCGQDTMIWRMPLLGRSGHLGPATEWDRAELAHPVRLLEFVAVFVVVAFVAQFTSCNVHEVGHAIVGTVVGWEVERINLCLPVGGSVEYSNIPRWAGNLQGYAGGVISAGFLTIVYVLAVARRRRPLQSPGWWAAGLGLVLFVGPQLVLAGMEGSRGPGEDYTELFQDLPLVFLPLLVLSAAGSVGLYASRWRAVWRSRRRIDQRE